MNVVQLLFISLCVLTVFNKQASNSSHVDRVFFAPIFLSRKENKEAKRESGTKSSSKIRIKEIYRKAITASASPFFG